MSLSNAVLAWLDRDYLNRIAILQNALAQVDCRAMAETVVTAGGLRFVISTHPRICPVVSFA